MGCERRQHNFGYEMTEHFFIQLEKYGKNMNNMKKGLQPRKLIPVCVKNILDVICEDGFKYLISLTRDIFTEQNMFPVEYRH